MKKVIYNTVIIIYAIIAVVTTVCLLSYNDFKVSVFGDNSLIIIESNDIVENKYSKGDLVIVNKKDDYKIGDKVFFYYTSNSKVEICVAEIIDKEIVTKIETTYTLEGDQVISSEYVIGDVESAKTVPALGSVLSVIESKWGFLFLIVFPSLLLFIYEIIVVITELRNAKSNVGK